MATTPTTCPHCGGKVVAGKCAKCGYKVGAPAKKAPAKAPPKKAPPPPKRK
jgi:DNA-directed RNA polymerase subunit RPC12/RpoP